MANMRQTAKYTLLDAVTPVAITSSTNATPIVVTKASHGLSTGDVIHIQSHDTNTAANRTARVTVLTDDTFSLQDAYTGADVAGNGTGGATGYFYTAPGVAFALDFRNAVVQINGPSGTWTVKVAGSIGKSATSDDSPDMADDQAVGNEFDFMQMIDYEDASTVDGDTGVAASAAAVNRVLEVNTNALRWITCVITAWTSGAVTVTILLTDND